MISAAWVLINQLAYLRATEQKKKERIESAQATLTAFKTGREYSVLSDPRRINK